MASPINDPNGSGSAIPIQPQPSVADIMLEGVTYDRKKMNLLRLQNELSPDLSSTPKIQEKVEGILKKEIVALEIAPENIILPSFTKELEVIEVLAGKLPEEDKSEADKAIAFCKKKAQETPIPVADAQIPNPKFQAVKEFFGQVILLLDINPKKALELINATYRYYTVEGYVKPEIEKALKALKTSLTVEAKKEKELSISNHTHFHACQLPKEIVKLIITSTGFFNESIVDLVQKELLSSETFPHQKEIARVLNEYKTNSSLRLALSEVKVPASQDTDSCAFIRASLGLQCDAIVDEVQAQRAHLACQLSPLAGTTQMATVLRNVRLDKCATDVNSLLNDGVITRSKVECRVSEDSKELSTPIKIGNTALLGSKIGYVWESKAFETALKMMGIAENEIRDKITEAITVLSAEKEELFEVTAKQIIVQVAQTFPAEEVAQKTKLGFLGFSSMTSNPVLRTWEEAMTTLGSHSSRTRMHGKILHCVQAALYNEFRSKNAIESAIVKVVFNKFLEELNSRITIEYLPTESIFKLRDITTADEFTALVINALTVAVAKETPEELTMQTALAQLVSKLDAFIKSKTFLYSALSHFNEENCAVSDEAIETLDALPWRAKYGNDPFEFLANYLETHEKPVAEFTPSNATQLLQELLTFAKKNPQAPNEILEIVSTQHASTLLPSFTKPAEDKDIEEFMTAYEIKSKREIKLTEQKRETIIAWIRKHVVNSDIAIVFDEEVVKMKKDLFLSDFRNEIFKLGLQYASVTISDENEKSLGRALNRFIFKKIFSDDTKAAFCPIAFADTHWKEKKQNVHLCFFQDPMTKSVKLGTILADGRGLLPINQQKWIENKPWLLSKSAVEAPSQL